MRDPRDLTSTYEAQGWWSHQSLADVIAEHAANRPDALAFISDNDNMSWTQYDSYSSVIASTIISLGISSGDTVAIMLADGPLVHAALVGTEKSGTVAVGIGPRAGDSEIAHLMRQTNASSLITQNTIDKRTSQDLVKSLKTRGVDVKYHIELPPSHLSNQSILVNGAPVDSNELQSANEEIAHLKLGPNDLWMLNSTSGTTGLPKCVTQYQNRWIAYHRLVCETAEISSNDIFMSLVPAQFGFGLWTSHFTPTLLGIPCVVLPKFTAELMLEKIEDHKVSLLGAVSTQFIMMLNYPDKTKHDLSSLRVMWTGGEAVPYERAAEFEERTGAYVLQFFGSNETGALSATSIHDSREKRLSTCGKPLPVMQVRLFDVDDGHDVTASGGPGIPGCKGPVTCFGYHGDDAANEELFTKDGWMLMGDIATIEEDGYLRLIGRKSDFIIRGGKNISARVVEEQVGTHSSVAIVCATAIPDEVFGQRVGVYIELRPGTTLTLGELKEHLQKQDYSKETFPEHLILVDHMPMASGGKIAKGEVKKDVERRVLEGYFAN